MQDQDDFDIDNFEFDEKSAQAYREQILEQEVEHEIINDCGDACKL